MLRVVPFILTCLLLAGCSKSETEPAAVAPRPTVKETVDRRTVIAVLGDSLAEGYGVTQGKSFPDVIQRHLEKDNLPYRVVNLGVSGDTTTGGLSRLAYTLSLKPEVVILELGGNDGLRGVPVASTKANLESMIVQSQKAGAKVLLAGMTLPPNYGADYIRTFESMYRDLAAKYKLPLIPFLMESIRAQLQTVPGLMQGDGIHPTAAGHELIADTVWKYLRPMLASH